MGKPSMPLSMVSQRLDRTSCLKNNKSTKKHTVMTFACSVASDSMQPKGLTAALQTPMPIGFSRQENWRGLPFFPQRISLTQGLNPCLLCLLHWQTVSLSLCHLQSPNKVCGLWSRSLVMRHMGSYFPF